MLRPVLVVILRGVYFIALEKEMQFQKKSNTLACNKNTGDIK